VVTLNVPAAPATKAVLLTLVIAGAWPTVSVNVCEGVLEPFVALMVIE